MAEQGGPGMGKAVTWLFAGIGLLAALAVIFLAATVLLWRPPPREPAPIEAKSAKQIFAVSDVTALHGTSLIEVVIATEDSIGRRGRPYSSGGGESVDERNVILVDGATGASRKLLADNQRQIVDRRYLPASAQAEPEGRYDHFVEATEGESKPPKPPLAYYVLRLRTADGAKEDLLAGDLATGRQAFLLTGIDGVDRIWMQSPTRVALLLRKDRKLEYRAIEIPALKVVAAQRIEID